MADLLQDPPGNEERQKFSPVTLILGAVVIAAIVVSFWFLFKATPDKGVNVEETVPLKMAPAELDYAKNLRIDKVTLSRAENGLNQQITILGGDVINDGKVAVTGMAITVEFQDSMNQVVLRETRPVLAPRTPALAAGETRPFEISFDNVPNSWNMQQPLMRLARLQLATSK